MHFATIASGSSGNSILVGEGAHNLLIDCGISARSLLQNLSLLGIAEQSIAGIVITHEHIDHVKGVGALARKLKIPIYATPVLWEELSRSAGKLSAEQKKVISGDFTCAGMQIRIFPTSHDSRESYGLRIAQEAEFNRKIIGIATDTGVITEEMNDNLTGCDALIVEANHDKDMLYQGRYPWYLKKRIAGEYGHLENSQLAEGLLNWITENTQKIVLAHLSEENNTPEMALKAVVHKLRSSHIPKQNPHLRLRVAPRYTPHELVVLS